MAIEDNTTYGLTGKQIKDLASKIKSSAGSSDKDYQYVSIPNRLSISNYLARIGTLELTAGKWLVIGNVYFDCGSRTGDLTLQLDVGSYRDTKTYSFTTPTITMPAFTVADVTGSSSVAAISATTQSGPIYAEKLDFVAIKLR